MRLTKTDPFKMDEMYAAEFMDACRELFECGRDSCDDNLMNHILRSMNQYMEKYPDEIKVGLEFAELIYVYAVGKMDKDAILEALEAKNYYKDRIIEYSKENHIKSLQQYIEINSQISELERDALTGFKTRKAYYKDIAIIECDEEMCNQPVGIAFADVNGLKKSMTIWDMKQEMSCSQQLRKNHNHIPGGRLFTVLAGTNLSFCHSIKARQTFKISCKSFQSYGRLNVRLPLEVSG